jgi:hypothetical protein
MLTSVNVTSKAFASLNGLSFNITVSEDVPTGELGGDGASPAVAAGDDPGVLVDVELSQAPLNTSTAKSPAVIELILVFMLTRICRTCADLWTFRARA